MSLLRELLQAKEPLFDESLRQLEVASHKQGVDVHLIADIHKKSSQAVRELGLDPADTTGAELFGALTQQAKVHDAHLAQRIGITPNMTAPEAMQLIKKAVANAGIPRDVWVLKKSVAKDMLRHMPPQHIMKLLGYRSVDSMLKRESLATLFGALRFAETPEWLNAFNMRYAKLAPTDFETRPIEIIALPRDPWEAAASRFVRKKRHTLTHVKEVGVIVLLPTQTNPPGSTLWTTGLLLHYINEIRLYSTFFKLQQVKKNFGDILSQTLIADPSLGPVMAGQHIHWRVIQRYFGKLNGQQHPEIFEPHVQPEDLHWRQAEETLFAIDSKLGFWKGLDYVAILPAGEQRPVSFNLLDVIASYSNGTSYADRDFYHFRESLWNEIFMRYMGQSTLRQQVLSKLDNDMIAPESIGRL